MLFHQAYVCPDYLAKTKQVRKKTVVEVLRQIQNQHRSSKLIGLAEFLKVSGL